MDLRIVEGRACVRIQGLVLETRPTPGLQVLGGRSLPQSVGEVSVGATRALCIGPSDWLLVSQQMNASELCAKLKAEIDGEFAIVDLSDGLATIHVSGAAARRLLSRGCGLDLHPQVFRAAQCARTRLADLAVVIDCLDEAGRFELHVSRSYAEYLYDWLTDASTA